MSQPHIEIKEPVQSTFCVDGIIIDGIKLLTFNTKVKRMKGKTAPLIENLLEDFHMPQGMNALLTSCFINILTIRGKMGLLLLGGPPPCLPLPKVFFSEPHSFSRELKSFLSEPLEIL